MEYKQSEIDYTCIKKLKEMENGFAAMIQITCSYGLEKSLGLKYAEPSKIFEE